MFELPIYSSILTTRDILKVSEALPFSLLTYRYQNESSLVQDLCSQILQSIFRKDAVARFVLIGCVRLDIFPNGFLRCTPFVIDVGMRPKKEAVEDSNGTRRYSHTVDEGTRTAGTRTDPSIRSVDAR